MAEDQIQQIKDKIDIADLVGSYVSLKKAGRNYKGLCPFHTEKTPSFMVSPELQIFKCFGCSKSGDIFSFVQEIEGYDFPEALRELAMKAGVKLKGVKFDSKSEKKEILYKINHLASEYFSYILVSHKIGKEALSYLKKRGIKSNSIEDFSLGYAPNSWTALSDFLTSKKFHIQDIIASGLAIPKGSDKSLPAGRQGFYDRFRGRIIFPLKSSTGKVSGFAGRVLDTGTKDSPAGKVGAKYVNTPQTLIFNKSNFLYGFDLAKKHIKKDGQAILAEGQMDVISAHQNGFKNVVASGGTALTPLQIGLLKRLTEDIVISFDSDSAGIAAAERGIEIARKSGLNVKVLSIPKEFDDMDHILQQNVREFKELLNNLENIYDFYYRVILSKFDISDPVGKKKIGKEILPIIKGMEDEVERAHYIRKLATDLDVAEESLISSMNSLSSKEHGKAGFREILTPKRSGKSLENYVITLILNSPPKIAKTAVGKLSQKDFSDELSKSVFTNLKSYLSSHKGAFNIGDFCAKLAQDLADKVKDLHLSELPIDVEDKKHLGDELKTSLNALKRESLKRDLRDYSRRIKDSEAVGDELKLKRLRKKFAKLSENLTSFQE